MLGINLITEYILFIHCYTIILFTDIVLQHFYSLSFEYTALAIINDLFRLKFFYTVHIKIVYTLYIHYTTRRQ